MPEKLTFLVGKMSSRPTKTNPWLLWEERFGGVFPWINEEFFRLAYLIIIFAVVK